MAEGRLADGRPHPLLTVVAAHGNVLAGQVAVDLCVLLPLITGTIVDVVHPYYMMAIIVAAETPSTGRGLAYYRDFAERRGGSLTIEEDAGNWSLTALFPC